MNEIIFGEPLFGRISKRRKPESGHRSSEQVRKIVELVQIVRLQST